jgi:L-fuconolactonase
MHSRYTRRVFLGQIAASALVGCARFTPEKQNASRIIDTHTHFYDPTRPQGVPWPPREDKLLYRKVLPPDYRALPVPRPVTGTVVVEASPWLADNQWILDLAASDPFIIGFVGNLAIGQNEFAEQLKRFATNRIFRGIRIGARKRDESVLRDLRLLADRDLSLDLLGGLDILDFAKTLAGALPSLRIVIDHLAGLKIDGKAPPAEWTGKISALSSHPNVYFKISGLVEGTGKTDGSAPRDAQFYAPVLEVMTQTFGAHRLIYASNWPVSERFAPLATVQGIVEDFFSSGSVQAQEEVFWRAGKAAYKWG